MLFVVCFFYWIAIPYTVCMHVVVVVDVGVLCTVTKLL